jgi:hypothetical protein
MEVVDANRSPVDEDDRPLVVTVQKACKGLEELRRLVVKVSI